MCLSHDFHSNPTLSQGLGISLLIFYIFFSKEVEHLGVSFQSISSVSVRIFGKPANNYNLGK